MHRRLGGDDVGLVAAIGEHAVDPVALSYVLAQRGDSHVAEHRRVQGVHPLLGGGGRMCCAAVVGDEQLLDGDAVHLGQIVVGGVHHHRSAQTIERTLSGHEHLPSPALLGRRAEHPQPSPGVRGDRCRGDSRSQTGCGDDVVPARVTDSRQRVVLAQHGDLGPAVARCGLECGLEAIGRASGVQPVCLEAAAQRLMGVVFAESQLGVFPDVV